MSELLYLQLQGNLDHDFAFLKYGLIRHQLAIVSTQAELIGSATYEHASIMLMIGRAHYFFFTHTVIADKVSDRGGLLLASFQKQNDRDVVQNFKGKRVYVAGIGRMTQSTWRASANHSVWC